MTIRARLPNRRANETFGFDCRGQHFTATISTYPSGALAEIFISNSKAGSMADAVGKDAAVVCSIALQSGVPLEVIRRALLRDGHGHAASPLGAALDHFAKMQPGG